MMDRVVDMTIKIVNERTVVEVFLYNKMKKSLKDTWIHYHKKF